MSCATYFDKSTSKTASNKRYTGRSLRMFENRVYRRIFGPERDEVTGEWRKLHNEELHTYTFTRHY
jgi:hypothetical protein